MIKIIQKVLSNYDLGEIISIETPNLGGYLNKSFLIAAEKGKFFLQKIDPLRNIDCEVSVLIFLSEKKFPGVKIIFNNNNKNKTVILGENYILSKFIDGYSPVKFNELSSNQIEKSAINLANFHKLMLNYPGKVQRSNTASKNEAIKISHKVKGIILKKEKKDKFDEQIALIIDRKIKLLSVYNEDKLFKKLSKCPKVFCHGDYHGANLIFDLNNQIIGIVDWEFCGSDYRIWEVARSMSFICDIDYTGSMVGPIDFDKALAYLKAYNKIFPLEPVELEIMVELLQFKALCCCFVLQKHYLEHNISCDQFLPKKPENWFWWLENGGQFQKRVVNKIKD